MNMKKTILLIVLVSGFIGCECFNAGTQWNIKTIELILKDKNRTVIENGIVQGDSLMIEILFSADFVLEKDRNFQIGIIPTANATSCESPGDYGLQDVVKKIEITSNSDFNTIERGNSLNEIIEVNGYKKVDEWAAISNSWEFNAMHFNYFLFKDRPMIGSSHIFKVKIELESGRIIEQETEQIKWN